MGQKRSRNGLDYLRELNEAQRKAVLHAEGPALVIAGAGSGKTRVLTYRVAHLLDQGVPAGSILALTFTNKAAREMKDRIVRVAGPERAVSLWMGTFHSIFARILRSESNRMGYPSNYTIYDTTDSKNLLKSILKELDLDDQVYRAGEVQARISSAKNNLLTAQAYAANPGMLERDKLSRVPRISDIFRLYSARCYRAGAMDFDDLLLNTNILLRDFPDVLRKYQERFRYVLVDEYQDTNYAQYLIVNKLGEKHRNVCVVGDDAQSIYSFRGARIENILNFRNDYPGCTVFKLEQNYRSTQTIVNAANSLIRKNRGQISKEVYSKNKVGEKITLVQVLTDTEEGFFVSNSILDRKLRDRLFYRNFAVLYRTNAQSRIFEEALRKRNIPYRVYGSISFYQRKEIKDMLGYFRLMVNKRDDEALKRIINYPARGIGKTTMMRLEQSAGRHDIPLWEVMKDPEKYPSGINQGTARKLQTFSAMIGEFSGMTGTMNAYDLAVEVATSTGILKELHQSKSPEELSKYENIQELLNAIREFTVHPDRGAGFVPLNAYLENVALLTDQDDEKDEERDKVTIMTVHSAKGLEFEHVFIVGVEEDLFPSHLAVSDARDLEEERRLFYVGLTRAREQVTISCTQNRFRWGSLVNCLPSRFIREIDPEFIDLHGVDQSNRFRGKSYTGQRSGSSGRKEYTTPSGKPSGQKYNHTVLPVMKQPAGNNPETAAFQGDDPSSIQTGMEVEHPRFGRGKVIHIEGDLPNVKATVFFHEYGQKQLLLKFAKLKIIDFPE